MKVCVTSTGDSLEAMVDPRFGRCSYFMFIDTETMKYEAVNNGAAGVTGGAGIQSAKFISGEGVEAVITGNFGPNATATLNAAGIKMYPGAQGVTVKEAINGFIEGRYREINTPSVESHFGMNATSGLGGSQNMGRSQGMGGGMGRGMGQGMGRGIGRGMGQGMGRGMGRGMDQGMGQGIRNIIEPSEENKDSVLPEISQLREKARQMEEELNALQKKINDLENKKSVSQLLVDKELCTGCGRCEEVCPRNAISVRDFPEIDHGLCSLCCRCVDECPVGALRIV